MSPTELTRLLQASAAVSAVALAFLSPRHRPVAAFMVGEVAANAARAWVASRWPAMGAGAGLLGGTERAAFHAHTALTLLWPAGLLALAVWTCCSRREWALGVVGASWMALSALVAHRYPEVRGPALAGYILGAGCAAALLSTALLWSHHQSGKGWTSAHASLTLLTLGELVILTAGPYRLGLYGQAWVLAQFGYCIIYGALTVGQGVLVWIMWRR